VGRAREEARVRWFLLGAALYGTVILVSMGALTYLARAEGGMVYEMPSGDRQYELAGYRYAWAPFHLAGGGRAPGELRVLRIADRRVIDRRQVEDVFSVRDVEWSKFNVTFVSQRNGRAYQTTLDLPQ
jgi:hypothetical protein